MADTPVSVATRARSALSLALIGAATLFAALIAHDILSFGPGGHDLIEPWGTPCAAWPCTTMNMVVFGQIAKGIGAAVIFALVGAFTVSLRGRLGAGGLIWAGQFLWSLLGMASGYRGHVDRNWRWWEPLTELAWAPGLTLPLGLSGLSLFLLLAYKTTARG